MSNYCACSGGDEEYTIELNQQGPSGPQGPVGPEGFSPSISVNTNTSSSYILTITNKEGSFNTPNLYGVLEKLNADLTNLPNPAVLNGVILSREANEVPSIQLDTSKATVDNNGNLVFTASSMDEGTSNIFNYELVLNPREQRLELHDNEGTVKVVAVTDEIAIVQSQLSDKLDKATYEADKATYATKEELSSTDATVASIQTELGNKLESSNIIAGANVTIDRSGNNLTISSTGGGGTGGAAINDSTTSSTSTWSSSKINSEITTVASEVTGIQSDVAELRETKNDNIFDISKFEIIGKPTISDDGITSGFNSANRVNIPETVLSRPNTFTNSAVIEIEYIPSNITNTGNLEILGGSTNEGVILRQVDNYLRFFLSTNGTDWAAGSNGVLYSNLVVGNAYKIRIEFSATGFDAYINGTLSYRNQTIGKAYSLPWELGRNGAEKFNLKQVKVVVDNVEIFNGLMESTKPIYDKIGSVATELSTFKTTTNNNFSAVNSALNEKANLSDLAGYVTLTKYNELLARVVALETEINGGNA